MGVLNNRKVKPCCKYIWKCSFHRIRDSGSIEFSGKTVVQNSSMMYCATRTSSIGSANQLNSSGFNSAEFFYCI